MQAVTAAHDAARVRSSAAPSPPRGPAALPGSARTGHQPHYWMVFAGLYALLAIGGPLAGAAVYVGAALGALRGPLAVVQALTVSWLVTMINPGLVDSIPSGNMLRILIVVVAFAKALSYLVRLPATAGKVDLLLLSLFCGIVAVASVIVSYAPDVSLFKLLNFYAGAMAVIVATRVAIAQGAPVGHWYLSLILTTVLVGFPLIATGLGYVRNGRSFQGLLNHPQAYGVFLAVAVAWLSAEILFARRRHWIIVVGLAVALVSLYASGARTAAVAVAAAYSLALLVRLLIKGEAGRWLPALLLGGVVLGAGLMIEPVRNAALDFALKGNIGRFASVDEAFERSRGLLLKRSLEGFAANPVFGIGFGAPSEGMPFEIERDPYFGLPVSAPVEKGFAFTALLEETGLVGAVLFLFFLMALLAGATKDSRPILLVGALAALFTNLGEAMLFSFGGMGLFIWLMLAFFAASGDSGLRRRARPPGR